MEAVPGISVGSRRNEDIALDMMKFVAMTTGYGKTSSTGVGFRAEGRQRSLRTTQRICWNSMGNALPRWRRSNRQAS